MEQAEFLKQTLKHDYFIMGNTPTGAWSAMDGDYETIVNIGAEIMQKDEFMRTLIFHIVDAYKEKLEIDGRKCYQLPVGLINF